MTIQEKIEKLAGPILERLGYKLWGCQCIIHQKQRLIRIFIDKAEGISLTDCEQASHALSAALDVDDVISEHYRLEISSPGIPRPLFYLWQYQENIGNLVHIKLLRAFNGQRWIHGTLISAIDGMIVVTVANEQHQIELTNVSKAHLEG